MRLSVVTTAVCLSIVSLAAADDVKAAIRKFTNIPAQGLGSALQTLARERDFQVVYLSDAVDKVATPGAVGELTADEALKTLLMGTGLSYRYLDEKTITVLPSASTASYSSPATDTPRANREVAQEDPKRSEEGEQKNSLWDRLRVAQVDQGKSSGASSVGKQSSSSQDSKGPSVGIEEIVVTAQKRSERLQDVPVPVTAISADSLLESNQLGLQDYFTRVPGLNVVPGTSSSSGAFIAIRGITTGAGTNPTVGITIDDVPYGSSTNLGGGNTLPDLDPGDLARVEVLHGPQGTLYGASSMGGLIKFVTVDPSTEQLSGRVQAGTDSVYNGAELGYNFRASVNVPLNDTMAVRVSAFTREDPGYIDNPVLHINGINEQWVSGGRLSGLWRPADTWSVKVSALYQNFSSDGVNAGGTAPGLGDLQQDYLRGSGVNHGNIQAYSGVLTGKIGSMDVTALSGYNIRESFYSNDSSSVFGSYTYPLYGVKGAELTNDFTSKKFTQEIRLSDSIGRRFSWLLGGFYTHENTTPYTQSIVAIDPTPLAVVADALHATLNSTYAELAGFADLTFHITDRFDVQLGGRESSIRQSFQSTTIDALFSATSPSPGIVIPSVTIGDTTHAQATPFTYLVTPSFKLSPELMVYARAASGYRPGGPNVQQCVQFNFPCQYDPDKTQDFELGAKGDFVDHRLSLDASLYYVDWKNIQVSALNITSGDAYNVNAGGAKSEGVELSAEAKPTSALKISAWVVWNDAELTRTYPGGFSSGDRLPFSSHFSGSLSLDQEFNLTGKVTGFVGSSISYIGNRLGDFNTPRQYLPGYAQTDLRAGARYESWTLNFFVNNVSDKRGLLDGPRDTSPPASIYIQPRTVGMNLAKKF